MAPEAMPSVLPPDAKRLTIVLTGGGSGGHITPVLAVAAALKAQRPDCRLIYVGQKGDKLGDLVKPGGAIAEIKIISSGKWRRYHGAGWRQLFDIMTLAKNACDIFRVMWGTVQGYRLLGKVKADGVFIKGGVPLGWAARLRHIPYVTLDLDALPSLANRLIAKHATAHAVGLPKEVYSYPPDKTFYVGVPIADTFTLVTTAQQAQWRTQLQLDSLSPVILVIGGGLGADRLNLMVAQQVPALLKQYPAAAVVHVVGREHESKLNQQYNRDVTDRQRSQVIVKGFVDDVYRYSGAADVIISRAGATSLAEFAAQGKACIVVPNPQLTGGHQLKNADQLAAHGAIKVVHEDGSPAAGDELLRVLTELINAPAERVHLGAALHTFAQPQAADKLAKLLLRTFSNRR